MARTEQFHIVAAFYLQYSSTFSYFSSSCFAQTAKEATQDGFICNPNSLRLPFNAWSPQDGNWGMHIALLTLERDYAVYVFGLASLTRMLPSTLFVSALRFSSSGRCRLNLYSIIWNGNRMIYFTFLLLTKPKNNKRDKIKEKFICPKYLNLLWCCHGSPFK